MDAFESLIETLLNREGYWTDSNLKVALEKAEKRKIGRPSSPRWELDVVGYQGNSNELLVVECKSYLDSRGVLFRNGKFSNPSRYKLFTERTTREVVLGRLEEQLVSRGFCANKPKVTLALAVGHMANSTDRAGLSAYFKRHKWRLLDDQWIASKLQDISDAGYENSVPHVVAKLLLRN